MTTTSAKTLDFRRTYWGRSWNVRTAQPDVLRGTCHATPAPHVGDLAVWRTAYGEATGRFTAVRWFGDPDDMFEVEVIVTKRRETR